MPHYGLTTTLPDGKLSVGPTAYFLMVACIAAFFVYINMRKDTAPKPKTASVTKEEDIKIDEVTSAASSFGQVRQADDVRAETLSTRRIDKTDASPATTASTTSSDAFMDTLTYVSSNLYDSGSGASNLREEPELRSPRRTTTRTEAKNSRAPVTPDIANLDVAKLIVYSDEASVDNPKKVPSNGGSGDATNARMEAGRADTTSDRVRPSGFASKDFLPMGTLIPVYLLTTVETTNLEDMVMFGVAENVVFNHDVRLPFGTRLIAQASQTSERDRIAFNVHTVLYPDGTELPMSGLVKDLDKRAGLRGYYYQTPLSVQLQQLALGILEDTQISSPSIPVIGGGATNGSSAASNGLGTIKQKILEDMYNDLRERYKPYVRIPLGTPAFVQLRNALDLKARAVNGGATNQMPVLKAFQQNPITPAGEVVEQAYPQELNAGGDLGRANQAYIPSRPRVSSNVVVPQQEQSAIRSVADKDFRDEVKEKLGEFQFLD